jgi:hypothetical protein
MAIGTRLLAALVAGVLLVSGAAEPAAGADRPPPTTNPLLGPIVRLITPPPRRPPPPPPPPPTRPAPPRPTGPAGSGTGKRIVYCVGCQRVWLVESDDTVSRTHLVSGRAGVPRKGTYSVFSKSTKAYSGRVTMANMVRFARGRSLAIGFHAIPRDRRGRPIQSERELGSYRSHGCVRQSDADSAALWNFAPIGTKVVVI